MQRAPERRVFYVDVGNMPPNKAMGFVERVKNEIHQNVFQTKQVAVQLLWMRHTIHTIMEDYFLSKLLKAEVKVEVLPRW